MINLKFWQLYKDVCKLNKKKLKNIFLFLPEKEVCWPFGDSKKYLKDLRTIQTNSIDFVVFQKKHKNLYKSETRSACV